MINYAFGLLSIIKRRNNYVLAIAFAIVYLAVCFIYLKHYFILEFTTISGILLLPYIIIIDTERRGAIRFFVVASLLFFAGCITKVTLLYFLSVGFALLFAIETYLGITNHLFIFIWGLLSSAFAYFNNAFGFPIRLEMTKMAGSFLTFAGIENQVLGNVIQMKNVEFLVDTACTGLKMMSVSLVITIFLLAYYQRRTGKNLSFIKIVVLLLVTILLNLLNNQIRIILLVYFAILPDNPMHYIIGLLGLTVYVIIPMNILVKWFYKKAKGNKLSKPAVRLNRRLLTIMNILLLITIICMAPSFTNKYAKNTTVRPKLDIKGYSCTSLLSNVIKMEKSGILIYIKPIDRFYEAEHSPAICWKGSGYSYCNVKKEMAGNTEIYTGVMCKENDTLYTAWWFDNGEVKTINQMKWRWNMAETAKPYYLININASTKADLMIEVNYLLQKNIFKTK